MLHCFNFEMAWLTNLLSFTRASTMVAQLLYSISIQRLYYSTIFYFLKLFPSNFGPNVSSLECNYELLA